MKRLIFTLLVFALMATPALAVPTLTADRVGAIWNPAVGGGEVRIVPDAELIAMSAETGPFYTFCMEAHEFIDTTGNTTYFASILTEAIVGDGNLGVAGPLGGDPLDPLTAFLYDAYRKGTLVNYNNDVASAGALQQAIWHIEDEVNWQNFAVDLSPQAQGFVNTAVAAAPTSIGNVRVLHIWEMDQSGKPIQIQDMLITVPAPGAIILGSIGVGLVGWLRRRRTL